MLGKIESRRRRGWQRMRCWMASPTQWTWVWVNSRWRTGKPGVLQSMGSQTVGQDWVTEQQKWHQSLQLKKKITHLFSQVVHLVWGRLPWSPLSPGCVSVVRSGLTDCWGCDLCFSSHGLSISSRLVSAPSHGSHRVQVQWERVSPSVQEWLFGSLLLRVF